ncbi:Uncharacterised protein [uncultured archaeon]|nr:Uncharacterised protein [uncultured archaeon]
MEPRLQDSKGSSGCSPQGLVASMVPGMGCAALILSMKITPGSPPRQAELAIRFISSGASNVVAVSPFLGLIRLSAPPWRARRMNSSVAATEMLKFSRKPGFSLASMNSRMSG